MRNTPFLTCAALALLAVSCAKTQEDDARSQSLFYAAIERADDTKAYADEDLRVLWDADDRISVFDHGTPNREYRFTGETGANSGWFEPVSHDGDGEGGGLDHLVYAVYPFRKTTSLGDGDVLTTEFPRNQFYRSNSFGPRTNTMVSVTEDEHLLFRNACGYLVLKLYGEDVEVASVALMGNAREPIAGKARLKMELDGVPAVKMVEDAPAVTLICREPVALKPKVEEAGEFWFALPPVVFEDGFTVVVTDSDGRLFVRSTESLVRVPRNRKVKMAPLGVDGAVPGYVFIDQKPACPMTSATGGVDAVNQKWDLFSDDDLRVRVSSYRCDCNTLDHIRFHLSQVDLHIPGVGTLYIPLERTTGDDYLSDNKSVAGAHLNRYRISDGGKRLEFDLTITLYQETKGDIRIVYSGPVD